MEVLTIAMEVELSKDTAEQVATVAKLLKVKQGDVVSRAIQTYLDTLHQCLDLKKEMKILDTLSDEALANFELMLVL